MKQSAQPIVPKLSSQFKNDNPITEKELVYQLESTAKDAVLLLPAKKEYLIQALKLKDDLMANAELFVTVYNSSLKIALDQIIPDKACTIVREKNTTLAQIIAGLFEPLLMLRSHIQFQIQEEVERVLHLRASTSSKRNKSSGHL